MARSYSELREKMSPEARDRAARLTQEDLVEMNLREVRERVCDLSQAKLGELIGVTQGAISQLEKRDDMHLSKLAEIVSAMGGRLTLKVEFDDGRPAIRINQFDDVKRRLLAS